MNDPQKVIDTLAAVSDYRYIAMDECGYWFAFTHKPECGSCAWIKGGKFPLHLRQETFSIDSSTHWIKSLFKANGK